MTLALPQAWTTLVLRSPGNIALICLTNVRAVSDTTSG